MRLFICERITGLHPRTPAPLKDKDLVVAFTPKGLCHPGTCSFILSGAIKYQGLIFEVFLTPLVHPGGILSDGRWNFFAAPPPVSVGAHVYDHRVRAAHQFFDLVNGNPGDFIIVACQANNRLAPNQQYYNPPPSAPAQKSGLCEGQDERPHSVSFPGFLWVISHNRGQVFKGTPVIVAALSYRLTMALKMSRIIEGLKKWASNPPEADRALKWRG